MNEPSRYDWNNVMVAIAKWIEIEKEMGEYQYMFESLEETSDWIWKNKVINKDER